MKDILIAIIILLTIIAGFSQQPPEQDSTPPPKAETQGTRERGESETIIPSDETELVDPPQSPKTGDWWLWLF